MDAEWFITVCSYIVETVRFLNGILERMDAHQSKRLTMVIIVGPWGFNLDCKAIPGDSQYSS
jgi:hypothetical protein